MFEDGPIMDIELARVEQMFLADPEYITSNLDISQESIDSLRVPGVSGPSMRSEVKLRDNLRSAGVAFAAVVAQLVSLSAHGPTLAAEGVYQSGLTPFFSTLLAVGGLISIDNTIGDYGITRQLQWLKAMARDFFDAKAADESARASAATFIVAYLMGAPVRSLRWAPAELETRMRFVFAEAPKVETTDPMISGLRKGGKMTMAGLKRTATIQMAAHALQTVDGCGVSSMTEYQKMLFADLGYHATNARSSDILDSEFPQKLLPTLSLFGYLQSVLILREAGSGAIEAVAEVLRAGGSVGDACVALEAHFDPRHEDAPVEVRKQIRLAEQSRVDALVPVSSQISTVVEARALRTSMAGAAVLDQPIERIPGTARALQEEEFLLGPDPWAQEVAQFARDLMNMKLKRDVELHAKVQQRTQEDIKDMASRLMPALAHKRALEEAEAPGRTVSSHAEAVEALKAAMAAQGLFDEGVPPVLGEVEVLDQLIRDALHVKKMHLEPLWLMALSAGQQAAALHRYLSGDRKAAYLARAWDAEQQGTGVSRAPKAPLAQQGGSSRVTMEQLRAFNALLSEAKKQGGGAGGLRRALDEQVYSSAQYQSLAAAMLETQQSERAAAPPGVGEALLQGCGAAHDALEQKAQQGVARVLEIERRLDSLKRAGGN